MRRWKPRPGAGLWVGIVLLLLTIGGAVFLGLRLAIPLLAPPESWPIDLRLYGELVAFLALLALGSILVYRVLAALTLRYELDRNGLYITWLGNRAVVPLDQIQTVDVGLPAFRLPLGVIQGIGYYWGRGRIPDGRPLHLFSTRTPARSLAIYTNDAVYAVSPADHEAFVQDLEQRRNLGSTQMLSPTVLSSRIFLYAFWNDTTIRTLLLIAFGINLAVLALLAARYPELGSQVQMRFNELGQVTELRPRHQVLFLPLAAFGLTLFNTALGLLLYRGQQLGAQLLQGASVAVQVLFGIAVVTIIW